MLVIFGDYVKQATGMVSSALSTCHMQCSLRHPSGYIVLCVLWAVKWVSSCICTLHDVHLSELDTKLSIIVNTVFFVRPVFNPAQAVYFLLLFGCLGFSYL